VGGIRIASLSKSFEGVAALKGVDLEIGDGEFLVLLGPSGCGKTTLLRCIAGLEHPSRGEIHLGEQCMFSAAADVDVPPKDRHIGFVFQSYALYPHMNVFRNVAFKMDITHAPAAEIRREVSEALKLVDLEGFETRSPRQLSGGQRQRVALARAIVTHPRTLLFDEPLSNLDVQLRASTRSQLKSMHRRTGATSLYVTHDQSEAMLLADRIAVMCAGEILQVGTAQHLYAFPETVTVAELTGELRTNLIDGEVHPAPERTLLIPAVDPYFFIKLPDECRRFGGRRLVVNVRPEDLQLLSPPSPDEGQASVLAVMPRGTDYLAHLRLGEHSEQIVATGTAADFQGLKPGQKVGVQFRRGNLYDASSGQLVSSFGHA
jgi:multiple sugar transport system ATP-binding protein